MLKKINQRQASDALNPNPNSNLSPNFELNPDRILILILIQVGSTFNKKRRNSS